MIHLCQVTNFEGCRHTDTRKQRDRQRRVQSETSGKKPLTAINKEWQRLQDKAEGKQQGHNWKSADRALDPSLRHSHFLCWHLYVTSPD